MAKKLLFLVLLVLLPYGLPEAQEIYCDTIYQFKWTPCRSSSVDTNCYALTPQIDCDTFWMDDTTSWVLPKFSIEEIEKFLEVLNDSLVVHKVYPDWQDSIEVYQRKIMDCDFNCEWANPCDLLKLIYQLQLQLFELQKRLEGE